MSLDCHWWGMPEQVLLWLCQALRGRLRMKLWEQCHTNIKIGKITAERNSPEDKHTSNFPCTQRFFSSKKNEKKKVHQYTLSLALSSHPSLFILFFSPLFPSHPTPSHPPLSLSLSLSLYFSLQALTPRSRSGCWWLISLLWEAYVPNTLCPTSSSALGPRMIVWACVCVCVRERDCVSMRVKVCVSVWERVKVC